MHTAQHSLHCEYICGTNGQSNGLVLMLSVFDIRRYFSLSFTSNKSLFPALFPESKRHRSHVQKMVTNWGYHSAPS